MIFIVLAFPRGIWGTFAERYGLRLMPVGYRLRIPGVKGLSRGVPRSPDPGESRT